MDTPIKNLNTIPSQTPPDSPISKALKAQTTPRVTLSPVNHRYSSAEKTLTTRRIHFDDFENQKPTKISQYISEIKADIKGKQKDASNFPEIANTIIKLGEYLRAKDLNKIPLIEIKALNELVLQLLNDPHFNFSQEKEKINLWAVHVDITWLAHEMKKKNIFPTNLLLHNTQISILEKGDYLIKNQTQMHDLLQHNLTAIKILWNIKTQTFTEVTKQTLQNTQKASNTPRFNKINEENSQLRQELKNLKEQQIKSLEEKERQIKAHEEANAKNAQSCQKLQTKNDQIEAINQENSLKLTHQDETKLSAIKTKNLRPRQPTPEKKNPLKQKSENVPPNQQNSKSIYSKNDSSNPKQSLTPLFQNSKY